MIGTSIAGIQQAQRRNLERIAAMKPSGRLGSTVRDIALEAHRFLVSVTHVDSGAYRAGHRVNMAGLTARINVDPSAVNPKGGRPVDYSMYEEKRGGDHAAYAMTKDKINSDIAKKHLRAFGVSLQ